MRDDDRLHIIGTRSRRDFRLHDVRTDNTALEYNVTMASLNTSDKTVPSSPSAVVFSDDLQPASSPPSSPPGFPWEQQKPSPRTKKPVQTRMKTAFSVLGKRKALQSIDDNARPKKKASTQATKPSVQPLTQMQISLGQEVQKKCKTCGMEYVQSSAEDRTLHDKYHKLNTEGYNVGKNFVQNARPNSTFDGVRKGDKICRLMCFDRPARKKRGQAALEVVQRELGAVEIPEKAIWDPNECSSHTDADYHAYMYIRGTKCIGFLLTQRINQAYAVIEPDDSHTHPEGPQESKQKRGSSARDALIARQEAEAKRLEELSRRPIELSKDTAQAIIGISRIWTSATHRHQGIAWRLLDVAYEAHNARAAERSRVDTEIRAQPDMQNGKCDQPQARLGHFWRTPPNLESSADVAFSQPTEAGTRLARRWFGKMFGWKVYVD